MASTGSGDATIIVLRIRPGSSSILFPSLRGLRLSWLPRDSIAGLMLMAIALPGQLATARLAGMPPEAGIVAFMAGSLAFAAFGASRFMSVGAGSTTAPIFAGALAALTAGDPSRYAGLAGALALMVGTILIVTGVLRVGRALVSAAGGFGAVGRPG